MMPDPAGAGQVIQNITWVRAQPDCLPYVVARFVIWLDKPMKRNIWYEGGSIHAPSFLVAPRSAGLHVCLPFEVTYSQNGWISSLCEIALRSRERTKNEKQWMKIIWYWLTTYIRRTMPTLPTHHPPHLYHSMVYIVCNILRLCPSISLKLVKNMEIITMCSYVEHARMWTQYSADKVICITRAIYWS